MRAIGFTVLAIALMVALVGAPAGAARSAFTGSEACASCHEDEASTWQRGPHASAAARLGASRRDRACQSCHMTGDAPAGASSEEAVGCEACHGAGAAYAPDDVMRDPILARALGLRDLSSAGARAAACDGCHRASTALETFDAEAAWARIGHGRAP